MRHFVPAQNFYPLEIFSFYTLLVFLQFFFIEKSTDISTIVGFPDQTHLVLSFDYHFTYSTFSNMF